MAALFALSWQKQFSLPVAQLQEDAVVILCVCEVAVLLYVGVNACISAFL